MLPYRHPVANQRINSGLIFKALLKSDRALLPGTISAKDNEELSTTLGDPHPNFSCEGYKDLEQASSVLQSVTTKDHQNFSCEGYKVLEQASPVLKSTTSKDHPNLTCEGYKGLEQVSSVLQSATTKDHHGYKDLEQASLGSGEFVGM